MMPMDPAGSWGLFWISMLMGLLFTLALLVLAVLAIIWLVRRMSRESRENSRLSGALHTDPRHELDVRYARGEIDRDTYLRMRDDLGTGSGAG
jgi:putative membrane protein